MEKEIFRPLTTRECTGKNEAVKIFDLLQRFLHSQERKTGLPAVDIEVALYVQLKKEIEDRERSGDLDNEMQAFDERHDVLREHLANKPAI